MLRVAVVCDHAGFSMKQKLLENLDRLDCTVLDLGAHEYDSQDDYPDFAARVGEALQNGSADRAILVCGSGVGASIAANKMEGVRAAVCHDAYSAKQGVMHDDMNVLCLGGRIVGEELAAVLAEAFVDATFTAEERHLRRLEKIRRLESGSLASHTEER
jgi:ribose 5-phosphate isomerase B